MNGPEDKCDVGEGVESDNKIIGRRKGPLEGQRKEGEDCPRCDATSRSPQTFTHRFLGTTRFDNSSVAILEDNMATISASCTAYSN